MRQRSKRTGAIRGPAPDWALQHEEVPLIRYQAHNDHSEMSWKSWKSWTTEYTFYPGSIRVAGPTGPTGQLRFAAQLVFESANVSLIRLSLENLGQPTGSWFNITGSGVNISASETGVGFALPKGSFPCFPEVSYRGGRLIFLKSQLLDGHLQPLQWKVDVQNSTFFQATSEKVQLAAGKSLVAFALISHLQTLPALPHALEANQSFSQALARWEGYLRTVLQRVRDPQMDWAAVKAVATLMGNWRAVPGLPPGVLPSYVGYEGGFWSWDTYKQAVGMVHFAPQLAKDQLRLLVSAQDSGGHIPDKVDRCGQGGGCSGKPPLLAWAVWEVYQKTQDLEFLREMYAVARDFHHFWYEHRDVTGTGLCSWTEGMESGMDDGVRFQSEFAKSVSNASTHVRTLDFWSIDLNSYLYQEKRFLSKMATALSLAREAQRWTDAADQLLPRLRIFFVERAAFFSDVYFNGSVLPIKGCEGFAALFNGVATLSQALKVVETLRDPTQFFLNFSLPTVSKDNKFFNAHGYWKGPTWIDQTWFAYTGLRRYESLAKAAGVASAPFSQLASELKQKIFMGKGFATNDTTPFTEHYDPDTGFAEGVPQFSWTAAHVLMWAMEDADEELVWI